MMSVVAKRVTSYIENNATCDPTFSDLAEVSGVSARTLYLRFSELLSESLKRDR